MPVKRTKGTPALGQVALSKNFYLNEFLDSSTAERLSIENVPNSPTVFQNIYKLALMLEEVRKACGNKAVFVDSGFRSPQLNAAVGGDPNSEHMIGAAADIRVPGYGSPWHVGKAILAANIPFGQLIYEGNWIHISLPDGVNDGQIKTAIFKKGEKTRYVPGMPNEPRG
jgi:zinc D-Ala-D-Ala carboxypeptidase